METLGLLGRESGFMLRTSGTNVCNQTQFKCRGRTKNIKNETMRNVLRFRPNRPTQVQPEKILPPRSSTPPRPELSPPKQQVRMTLKNPVKPVSRSVLEKLGNVQEEIPKLAENLSKRKSTESEEDPVRTGFGAKPERKEKKKEKKSAADRREELMKQLKAVENAIAKKRSKINSDI